MGPPDAGEPTQEVTKTIVVTGSRIPRPNLTAVSPVTVVGQQEVKLEGIVATEELLNQLPQVAPSQGPFVSNSATGTATVDLRNLGPLRTLTLVNGRRLGPGDPSLQADLNMIPASLIQRVEVLTGGASSVYGSDAVAGVVNAILDTRFDGVRIDGQASVFQHDNRNSSGLREALIDAGYGYPSGNVVDGGRQDINVVAGTGLFDDRAHVAIYGGYRHFDSITQDKRDYSACTAQVDNDGDNTVLFCGGSPVSYPGNFVTFFDVMMPTEDRTFQPGFTFFNFGPWNYFQRPDDRYTAGGFADFEVSPAFHPYLEAMYLDDRSVAQLAPSADFGNTSDINCDNPLLSAQQLALVCYDGNYVGQFPIVDDDGNLVGIEGSPVVFTDPATGDYLRGNLLILRRGVDSGPRQSDFHHETMRIVGGANGEVGRGITYDASYLHVRTMLHNIFLNDYSVSRMLRALDVVTDPVSGEPVCRSVLNGQDPDCVPWDIFVIGGVTPEAAGYVNVPSTTHSELTEQVANANLTVDLGEWGLRSPWADENPQVNFGAEYRRDKLDYEADPRAAMGDLAGSPQDFPVHGSTDVKELFIEGRFPLLTNRIVERFAVEAGYRQSWYSNPESGFVTNAYKLAVDLTAVPGLRFRGSNQRAVRAPNINELFFPAGFDGFFEDPCVGPTPDATQEECARTGVSPSQYGHVLAIPNQDAGGFAVYNSIIGGNPELGPETATTWTAGVVLEPKFLPGFNATIDWWKIDLQGAIGQVGSQAIMDTCIATGGPLFCSRIHRDSTGSLWLTPEGFIDDRLANLGSYKFTGVDVAVNYRHELGRLGTGSLSLVGTYQDKVTVDVGGLADPIECAGRFGWDCFAPVPRWRHMARVSLEARNGMTLSMNWRYTGEMSLNPPPGLNNPPGPLSSHLPAYSFFDLAALFRVQKSYTFRIGVNNIFDREPPLVPAGEGAAAGWVNGNTYSMWYDPLGRYIFAGFTASF